MVIRGLIFLFGLVFIIGIVSAGILEDCEIYGNCKPTVTTSVGGGNVSNYYNITNNYNSLGVNLTQLENSTVVSINQTWLETLFVRISNLPSLVVSLVGNWSLDKSSYNTTVELNHLYAPNTTFGIGSLYNLTASIIANLSISQLNGYNGWNLSGTNLFTGSDTYNVGIGTTSPTDKLNVVGNVNMTANVTIGYLVKLGITITLPVCGTDYNASIMRNNSGVYGCSTNSVWTKIF